MVMEIRYRLTFRYGGLNERASVINGGIEYKMLVFNMLNQCKRSTVRDQPFDIFRRVFKEEEGVEFCSAATTKPDIYFKL